MTLERHVHNPAPELVAAALLHDISRHGPTDVDVDAVLTVRFTGRVARIVWALQHELDAAGPLAPPVLNLSDEDRWTLQVSAADKMVTLGSMLRRAANALDLAAYWEARAAFVARLPYFAQFHTSAAPHLPPSMAGELARLVVRAEQATAGLA
jgi:hypothetical protein